METVIRDCREGRPGAWESLVDSFAKRIFSMAYRFSGNREEAEDMTQEIFIKLWRSLPHYDSGKDFAAWFTALARNHLIDEYRKKKLEKSLRNEFDERVMAQPAFYGPEEEFARLEARERLVNELAGLSSDMRTVVIMRDIEGHSYEEISETLQLPIGTVKSRVNRGRLRLAELVRRKKGGRE